ncbi:YbhB/YbcL family Raf kinase inhibitor-like protein [Sphingomonas glacialis]|uniref:YbhB/YbcL family Raf kinase inhibitor-like protein n=1 Tax=Sphingomonas glacialis TaxID=658225 RepID=A0A502FFZ9_9SPHN|nr:YbhB/YbcL family Raf kinase inhibitor-like protein [Sphingomonas glacialis]TPG48236.1 YbhB/YbcL family Raf kinase inhibitor-like protein [Sphingomonas glacialis]
MLEHVPEWLGASLRGVRAGAEHLAIVHPSLGIGAVEIALSSPAFGDFAEMPVRFTADGEGVSPPLQWTDAPAGTQSLALIVEDADSPTPAPLVHAILWGMNVATTGLAEGAIAADGAAGAIGINSFLSQGWLAPDPPSGHGEHRYVFQLFALDCLPEDLGDGPGRGAVLNAMAGHVIGAGILTGLYSRGEVVDAPVATGGPAVA